MKNIVKAIAVLAGVASLAACNKYADYNWTPFVSMDIRSATIEESDPATNWTLPVHLYNYASACTVTYTVEAVSATAGVDYTVADASGVLNFTGNDTQNITIAITGQPGTYTGNLMFRVKLASATNDVTLGAISTCNVTIKDLDHPLSALFGEYDFSGITYASGWSYPTWTMTMGAVDGDPTKVVIDNITPFSVAYASYVGDMSVIGTVSADKKKITVAALQTAGDASAFGYDTFTFYKHGGASGEYITDPAVVTFTYDEETGAWITSDSYGFSHPDDLVDYPDLFYSYCVIFSDFNPKYPTYFKKK